MRLFSQSLLPAPTVVPLNVAVRGLGGQELHMELSDQQTVDNVQGEIAVAWGVPPEFQRVISGTSILTGTDILNIHLPALERDAALKDGRIPTLQLTFVFSDGGVLSHESVAARRSAIDTLRDVATKGNKQVLEVLISFLSDDNDLCRHAAVLALTGIGDQPNDRVIDGLSACLADSNELVSSAAVRAVAKASVSGSRKATDLLFDCMECSQGQSDLVRLAVVEGVSGLSPAYDDHLITALSAHVEDTHAQVRRAALSRIVEIALRGNSRALEFLFKCVQHRDQVLQHTAVATLTKAAGRGSLRHFLVTTTSDQ